MEESRNGNHIQKPDAKTFIQPANTFIDMIFEKH